MKISSIVDIVDGELLNTPSISSIYSIKCSASKVKEADLFFAKNKDELNLAIQNGAFATIFEDNFNIQNSEIALIKVKDIKLAMIKLIRFKLSNLNLNAFFCSDITYDILKIYQNSQKKLFLIPKQIEDIFEILDDIKDSDYIFSSSNDLLDKIYPKNSKFEKAINPNAIKNLIEHSLFETTFSYKSSYFYKVKISSLYIENLINVYSFFENSIDISKLKNFSNFKTIFLNANLQAVEFGKSSKFLICQDNLSLVKDEILFIKDKYKYAKYIFITKNSLDFLEKNEQIVLDSYEDLKKVLKNSTFNAVYLVGFDYSKTLNFFQQENQDNLLLI